MKFLTFVFVAGALVACGKKDDGGSGGGASTGADKPASGDDKGGDPNAWKDLSLDKLGLVAHVPGNAKVGAFGGISSADYKCRLDVFDKGDTFDNWVANIEKGNKGGALKDMVKKDKTDDDNWVIQWTTDKKFGYVASKKIGDKVYQCVNFQADSQEKIDCTIKMCDSLKAK